MPADAVWMHRIKEQLPIDLNGDATSKGGFLLGTTIEQYRHYIAEAHCLVAEVDDAVVGFGIIITNDALRRSDVWVRRQQASWNIELSKYEPLHLTYFEQLGFLAGYKRLAIKLAYKLIRTVFDEGCDALFTTTVHEPIKNLAAVPFIQAADGTLAGNIDEEYPVIGHINSDIYVIERAIFYESTARHPLYPFLTTAL